MDLRYILRIVNVALVSANVFIGKSIADGHIDDPYSWIVPGVLGIALAVMAEASGGIAGAVRAVERKFSNLEEQAVDSHGIRP